jgi:hypothetical protein
MSKTKQIKLTVDLDLFEQISRAADEKELPISTYIRYVVANKLDESEDNKLDKSEGSKLEKNKPASIDTDQGISQGSSSKGKRDNVISLRKLLGDENKNKAKVQQEKTMLADSGSKKSPQDAQGNILKDIVDKRDINIHIHV